MNEGINSNSDQEEKGFEDEEELSSQDSVNQSTSEESSLFGCNDLK